jgi:Replication-relaxation
MAAKTRDSVAAGHRRARFERAISTPIHLTDDDLCIIKTVARCRFLRSTHIVQLLSQRSPRKVIERLCALYHAGFLDRPRAQINYFASAASAPIIYALGNRGAHVLAERTLVLPPLSDWTDKNREAKRPYIEHALLLADLMLPLETGLRDCDDIDYVDADALLATVRVRARHAENPWATKAVIRHNGAHHVIPAIPDAVFALHFKKVNRQSYFFVEADRATMPISRSDLSQSSYRRRLLTYLAAHKEKQHVERFGFHNLRVLTVTTSAERVASMIAEVRDITGGRGSGIFLFADQRTLASHGHPLVAPWTTSEGPVRIDQPPRFLHAGHLR